VQVQKGWTATSVSQVVEKAAGGAVGGVHGTHESPGLGQQLAHSSGLHRGKELASVGNSEEVRRRRTAMVTATLQEAKACR